MTARDHSKDLVPAPSLAPVILSDVNTEIVDLGTHEHVLFDITVARRVYSIQTDETGLLEDLAVGDIVKGDTSGALAQVFAIALEEALEFFVVPISGTFVIEEDITRVEPGADAALGTLSGDLVYAPITSGADVTVVLYHSADGISFGSAVSLLAAQTIGSTTSEASILVAASRVNRYVRLRLLGSSKSIGAVCATKFNARNDAYSSVTASLL